MQIGFSLIDLALGGAQTFLAQLASGLSGRGHQICYYVYTGRDDPLHTAPSLLAAFDAAGRAMNSPDELLRCTVIQLDGYHSLLRKLPFMFHLSRCVETYHSLYSVRRSGPVYPPNRVAVSMEVLARLPQPAELIYQGIPMPPPPPPTSRLYDLAILGRIHPVKGHRLFLSVCEELYRKRGSLSALIIGGHPQPGLYQQEIDRQIDRLRAEGLSIHGTGDVAPEDVYAGLSQAKVLLVTSQNEGFGRMAVEALACETPVVANPVGGLREIVKAGETGFLAEKDQPSSFASLAAEFLEDEAMRIEFGQRGRRDVEERFSLGRMLDLYEALYRRVAGGG